MAIFVVGVDVSKAKLDVAYCTAQLDPEILGVFKNDSSGFEALAEKVVPLAEQSECDEILLVAEPTGGYERRMACFAIDFGWQVSLPNPAHVSRWSEGLGRSKTDRQDALTLARYGRDRNPLRWTPMPEEVALLVALLDRQTQIERMLRQETNRRKAYEDQKRYVGAVAESIEASISYLKSALAEIKSKIDSHMDQHPDLQDQANRLDAIPGVGDSTMLPLMVLCAQFEHLAGPDGSAKSLTAYVGLDSVHHESGSSVRRRSRISRQGNSKLRAKLYMAALGGTRCKGGPIREFYDRLIAAGKPAKLALIACARKILVWAWAVYRTRTPFDPAKACARAA